MIEYPRKGLYTVGFAMGRAWRELEKKNDNAPLVNVFVPTTPNPTSGFLFVVPVNEVRPFRHDHGRSVEAHYLRRIDYPGRSEQKP